MSKHQIDQQIAFLRRELTKVTLEMAFSEGLESQALRIRQNRLSNELDRLQRTAVSGQLSAVSFQLSAVSGQRSTADR
jgi:hypothetical protein